MTASLTSFAAVCSEDAQARGAEPGLCARHDLAPAAFVHLGLAAAVAAIVVFKAATMPVEIPNPVLPARTPASDLCASHPLSRVAFDRWARRLLSQRSHGV